MHLPVESLTYSRFLVYVAFISSNIDKCERQIEKWTLVSVPTARHPPSPNLVDEAIQEPFLKFIYQSNLHSRVLVYVSFIVGC